MNKKEQLASVLAAHQTAADNTTVRRLLSPLEWDVVAGGDGHAQDGRYTQTSGNFAQQGGGHGQTGGGSYGMSGMPVKSRPNYD